MAMMKTLAAVGLVAMGAGAAFAGPAGEVTVEFGFPTFGFFETFFGSGHTEFDGYTVTGAQMYLELDVLTGDAANIQFFQSLPVDLDPGTAVIDEIGVFTTGELLGWSGTGTFSHSFDVSGAVGGAFLADTGFSGGLFGTFGQIGGPPGETAVVTENSVFSLTLEPVPTPASVALMGLAAPFAARRRRG